MKTILVHLVWMATSCLGLAGFVMADATAIQSTLVALVGVAWAIALK